MPDPGYTIRPIVSAPFDQVAYVLWRDSRADAIVFDPGFDWPAIDELLRREGKRLAAIVNTHGHADHIAGNAPLKQVYPDAALIIGRAEAPLLNDPERNLSAPFGMDLRSPPADRLLNDGDRLELAGFAFVVIEIAGHSPGGLVLVCREFDPSFAIGGDILFQGSIGRSDFPGGDGRRLIEGIRSKLFHLPDNTIVYPGHGPPTTIGEEKRHNPFVRERARFVDPGLST